MNGGETFLGAGTILNAKPQVQNAANNMISSICKIISGTFCAEGGESWIVISNFKTDGNTHVGNENGNSGVGYLIIDELSLRENNCLAISSITALPDSVCPGSCTDITVNPSGGSGTYTYLWSPGGQTTKTITVCPTASGTSYKCKVSSSFGCSVSASTTDSFRIYYKPYIATPTISTSGSTTICKGDSVKLVCSNAPNYLWNPGGMQTQSIVITKAGTYNVTVKHPVSSCKTTSADIDVFINSLPVIDTTTAISHQTSCGLKDGSITGIKVSGAPILKYAWDGGPKTTATPDLTGAGIGTHTLVVTDGNGCVQSTTGKIWNKDTPDSATVKVTSAIICEGLKTVLYVSPSDPTIIYKWITPFESYGYQ